MARYAVRLYSVPLLLSAIMSAIIDPLVLLSSVRKADEEEVEILDINPIVRQAWRRIGVVAERHKAENVTLPEDGPAAAGDAGAEEAGGGRDLFLSA